MLIKGIKYFMIISGTWDAAWTANPSLRTVQVWYRRTIWGLFFLLLLLTLAKLIQLILIGADGDVIYACASMLLTCLGALSKISIFKYNKVSRLFREIINEEKKMSVSLDDKLNKSYNSATKVWNTIKNAFVIGLIVSVFIFFPIKPINYIRDNKTAQKSEKEMVQESLMCPIWLPYKESDHVVSVIFLNIILVFAWANIYMATQIISFALMAFAAAELKIVQVLLQNLATADNGNTNQFSTLRKIAIKHFFVISFVNKLNNYTRYYMLTDFLLNSINVASVATEILIHNTARELAAPILHFVNLVIVNVFFLGWFANEINVQSLAIGDVLYQSKWYNQNDRTKKLFLVICRQTQRPLTLSIGPFGPMTLGTVLRTLQAAYSYVTLLRNFK